MNQNEWDDWAKKKMLIVTKDGMERRVKSSWEFGNYLINGWTIKKNIVDGKKINK